MEEYTIQSTKGKLILFATILASGMAFLDGTVVNIAVPTIQKNLHASLSGIQWIINGYALMLCALILISGVLGDRFGRKRIFMYGIGIFILASFLCSVSQSITQLILFRSLQGIGGAMMVPGSLSIINASFAESVRGRAIGLWSGYSGGLIALGPFLGGYLVQAFGWPSIFYINIPFGLLALFIALRFVPETKGDKSRKIDFVGAIIIFLSLLGIAYGLITGPDKGWGNDFSGISLISGIAFFVFFIIRQIRVKDPLVPIEIFKSKLVTGSNLVTLFLYFALSGVLFFLILDLQQIQHFSPLMSGLAMLPTIILITFLSGPAGSLADKIGPRIPMIVGPLIVSVGMGLIALSGKHVNYFTQIMPGLILFGLGMALVIAPLTKSALAVESRFSGAASGVNNAVARIAGLLAVALLGVVMLSLFQIQLHKNLANSPMNNTEQKQIINQQNKLAGIDMPTNFSSKAKTITENVIEDSFIYGFKWTMGINSLLAFLSAIISFFTIYNKKLVKK